MDVGSYCKLGNCIVSFEAEFVATCVTDLSSIMIWSGWLLLIIFNSFLMVIMILPLVFILLLVLLRCSYC